MNGVEYVLGSGQVAADPLRVFDAGVCGFIAELSAELLNSPLPLWNKRFRLF